MRGGLGYIANPFGQANNNDMRLTLTKEQFDDLNKYMQSVGKKDISYYDQSKTTKNIVYLDGNNLYGWAISLSYKLKS